MIRDFSPHFVCTRIKFSLKMNLDLFISKRGHNLLKQVEAVHSTFSGVPISEFIFFRFARPPNGETGRGDREPQSNFPCQSA